MDEWLSGLDDLTARAVAFTVAKTCRTLGIAAILACCRESIAADLEPDIHVKIGWNAEPEITHRTSIRGCSSIVAECRFERGATADWKALKPLHYAAGDPATVHSVWTARHPACSGPAAVAVLSWPDLHSAARNLATGDEYICKANPAAVRRLNREVLKLSRIVVTPELRGLGIARALLTQVIGSVRTKWIECVTALGKDVGFLESLGFREVLQTPSQAEAALLDWSARVHPPASAFLSPESLAAFVASLSVRGEREGRRLIWHAYHQLVLWRRSRRNLPRKVPNAADPAWPEAFDVASRRLAGRPAYWLLGPLDLMSGLPEETDGPMSVPQAPPAEPRQSGVETPCETHMPGTCPAHAGNDPHAATEAPAEDP